MKEGNYLNGIEHEMDVGYSQFKDRKLGGHACEPVWHPSLVMNKETGVPWGLKQVDWFGEYMEKKRIINETRLFNFDGLFVEVTLPRGGFDGK